MSGPGTNTGHGHVWARPDGVRARCGGPGICDACSRDAAQWGSDVLAIRVKELEDAIRAHRDQKADDRCILDDDKLYAVLKDGIKCDRRVGDKDAMLANCKRFIEQRCEAGGWPTYAELENRIARLERRLGGVTEPIG